ncbi:hypothetical protein TNCV_2885211 [Trichonephila clavipes]|nr:hypothetical protein TNCV_2885211 [Trichonephila clavipes]
MLVAISNKTYNVKGYRFTSYTTDFLEHCSPMPAFNLSTPTESFRDVWLKIIMATIRQALIRDESCFILGAHGDWI